MKKWIIFSSFAAAGLLVGVAGGAILGFVIVMIEIG